MKNGRFVIELCVCQNLDENASTTVLLYLLILAILLVLNPKLKFKPDCRKLGKTNCIAAQHSAQQELHTPSSRTSRTRNRKTIKEFSFLLLRAE